jgi:hypothetical protein
MARSTRATKFVPENQQRVKDIDFILISFTGKWSVRAWHNGPEPIVPLLGKGRFFAHTNKQLSPYRPVTNALRTAFFGGIKTGKPLGL